MHILTKLFNLLWPVFCPNCLVADVKLCASCSQIVADGCKPRKIHRDTTDMKIVAVFEYADIFRNIILAWKDHGREDLFGVLNIALRCAVEFAVNEFDFQNNQEVIIIPSPSAKSSLKARGRQQTIEIAQCISQRLNEIGINSKCVNALKKRNQSKQVKSGANARLKKSEGAITAKFMSKNLIKNKYCLIVDDIVTTGATLAQIKNALENEGAKVVCAIAIAATAEIE